MSALLKLLRNITETNAVLNVETSGETWGEVGRRGQRWGDVGEDPERQVHAGVLTSKRKLAC